MAIYTVRTTANREDQVLDFVSSNAKKRNLSVYSIIHPHGMRGYIFIEAETKEDAEQSFQGVPYARGLLKRTVSIKEIESMLASQTEIDVTPCPSSNTEQVLSDTLSD